MQAIALRAQPILSKYTDPSAGVPDPSWLLSLPDEVYTNSNLFAVQKMFDGEFQFDIFFESASAGHTLSGQCLYLTMHMHKLKLT
jgi:mannosyl-oligosaccharide glucosidase